MVSGNNDYFMNTRQEGFAFPMKSNSIPQEMLVELKFLNPICHMEASGDGAILCDLHSNFFR